MREGLPAAAIRSRDSQQLQALHRARTELGMLCGLIDELLLHLAQLEERIARVDRQILHEHQDNAACKVIESILGMGVMTATAVISSFGRAEMFTYGPG